MGSAGPAGRGAPMIVASRRPSMYLPAGQGTPGSTFISPNRTAESRPVRAVVFWYRLTGPLVQPPQLNRAKGPHVNAIGRPATRNALRALLRLAVP
jgi:hypothetical protein